jgi:hypothetical protein
VTEGKKEWNSIDAAEEEEIKITMEITRKSVGENLGKDSTHLKMKKGRIGKGSYKI